MYTKLFSTVLTAAVLTVVPATPLIANAAQTPNTTSTTATVGLKAGTNGSEGPLSFKSAPNIAFASDITLNGASQTVSAQTVDAPVSVSDLRGTGAGWDVSVTRTAFQTADGSHTLNGVLTLPAGTASATANDSKAPTTNQVVVNDQAASVESAATGSGLGSWDDTLDAKGVTLQIPNGAYAGAYTSTLTWTLADAPK